MYPTSKMRDHGTVFGLLLSFGQIQCDGLAAYRWWISKFQHEWCSCLHSSEMIYVWLDFCSGKVLPKLNKPKIKGQNVERWLCQTNLPVASCSSFVTPVLTPNQWCFLFQDFMMRCELTYPSHPYKLKIAKPSVKVANAKERFVFTSLFSTQLFVWVWYTYHLIIWCWSRGPLDWIQNQSETKLTNFWAYTN